MASGPCLTRGPPWLLCLAHAALAVPSARPVARVEPESRQHFPRGGFTTAARLYPGIRMTDKPMILVLCTGNSARSQMAEAFLKKYKADDFSAASAGTQPKPEIHPLAVRVMNEIGIDISG